MTEVRRALLVPLSRTNRQHYLLGFVDGRIGIPRPPIHVNGESKRHPRGTLVAIEQWMVLREPHEQYCRLVNKIWVEVLFPKARRRRVQRGIRQIQLGGGDQRSDLEIGDGCSNGR